MARFIFIILSSILLCCAGFWATLCITLLIGLSPEIAAKFALAAAIGGLAAGPHFYASYEEHKRKKKEAKMKEGIEQVLNKNLTITKNPPTLKKVKKPEVSIEVTEATRNKNSGKTQKTI